MYIEQGNAGLDVFTVVTSPQMARRRVVIVLNKYGIADNVRDFFTDGSPIKN